MLQMQWEPELEFIENDEYIELGERMSVSVNIGDQANQY